MQTLTSRSLARVLSDIGVVFASGDDPEPRLTRAIELLQQVVPYARCALLTLRPRELYLACPPASAPDGLRDTVCDLLAEVLASDERPLPRWPRWDSHLAVPLVDPDVQVIGLLLLVRDSGPYEEFDLQVLSTVAGQMASYLAWLQYREERSALLAREQAAHDEAERANRAKDSFLATLSHELRSPLNAIVGWSDMLLRRSLAPDVARRALDAIHRNARAQAHLIDDVLDVSRIISDKFAIDKQPIDLTAVIQASVEAIRPTAEGKGVDLVAYLDDAAIPLSGDASRLQQVFSNLLENAAKFTPQGGRISVTVARVGTHVLVQVLDSGVGIEGAALPHVFDRFFQQDASMTRRYAGLGLGLAIVKHIVEQHGGSVRVESEGVGRGASFTVTLPVESVLEPAADAPPLADGGIDRDQIRLNGLRVLVVDDEHETRELLAALLGERGVDVAVAVDANAALAHLDGRLPDLLIADIAMPGKDGFALIQEVRERGIAIPAIALSAHGRGEDRLNATTAGFDLHLAKPALPGDLLAAVAVLTRRAGAAS